MTVTNHNLIPPSEPNADNIMTLLYSVLKGIEDLKDEIEELKEKVENMDTSYGSGFSIGRIDD